jgi:hypothetical protein
VAKEKKEKKDPWAEGNYEDTIAKRKSTFENLRGTIKAIDGELEGKIARRLLEHGESKGQEDNTPNYEYITKGTKGYDSHLVDEIKDMIEDHYTPQNVLSPLKKAWAGEKADFGTNQLVARIYHKHKDAVVQSLGNRNFQQQFQKHSQDNLNNVLGELMRSSAANYSPDKEEHAKAAEYIVKQAGADPTKLDMDRVRREFASALGPYLLGELNQDALLDAYRKQEDKKKKK